MMESRVVRVRAPAVIEDGRATDAPPSTIVKAAKTPLRVLVRNTSFGATVWLAYSVQDLQTFPPTSGVYDLPPGESDVFVLSPGQGLFVAGDGPHASVSAAISDALPLDFKT